MSIFLWILVSTLSISLIALIGVFALFLKEKFLDRILLLLVGLSAGAMMGGAFFHLLPQAIEKIGGTLPFVLVIAGFVGFFLMEKILHWRHCHHGACEVHVFGYLNLIGDSIHNFMDGLIIAAAFLVDINLGIITTMVIGLHEIPQEMSDFGVLIYSGFKKGKALLLNYLAAFTVVVGGVIGYFLGVSADVVKYLLPIAAGGFLYISAADLLPELKRESSLSRFLLSFLFFLIGLGAMYLSLFLG